MDVQNTLPQSSGNLGRKRVPRRHRGRRKRITTNPGKTLENNSQDFIHEALDLTPEHQCIRLLKILPSRKDDIQCEIIANVHLVDHPGYAALSYEW